MTARAMGDLYSILEVDPAATVAELKRAYRRRVMETHPDRAPARSAEFLAVQGAWETLGDTSRRAAYDARRSGQPPPGVRVTYESPATPADPPQPSGAPPPADAAGFQDRPQQPRYGPAGEYQGSSSGAYQAPGSPWTAQEPFVGPQGPWVADQQPQPPQRSGLWDRVAARIHSGLALAVLLVLAVGLSGVLVFEYLISTLLYDVGLAVGLVGARLGRQQLAFLYPVLLWTAVGFAGISAAACAILVIVEHDGAGVIASIAAAMVIYTAAFMVVWRHQAEIGRRRWEASAAP